MPLIIKSIIFKDDIFEYFSIFKFTVKRSSSFSLYIYIFNPFVAVILKVKEFYKNNKKRRGGSQFKIAMFFFFCYVMNRSTSSMFICQHEQICMFLQVGPFSSWPKRLLCSDCHRPVDTSKRHSHEHICQASNFNGFGVCVAQKTR